MPELKAYTRELPYSYAPGLFPSLELMRRQPELARRLLVSSRAENSEGLEKLRALCRQAGVREEQADRALARISGKGNCFAAVAFEKRARPLDPAARHLALHHPGDRGNLGTILRTALGFGYLDVAVIRPAADVFDPHVVRASMGAFFGLRVAVYDDFAAYRAQFPARALYPFMLDGACLLEEASRAPETPFTLIFGNEGSGLPAEFARMGRAVRIAHSGEIDSLNLSVAAAIGMYAFR